MGTIDPSGSNTTNIPAGLVTLEKATNKILKFIAFHDEYHPTLDVPFDLLYGSVEHSGEKIEYQFLGRDRYRKGAIYYVFQKSDRGVRFLVYTSHKVFHSSIALGTILPVPSPDELISKFKEIINEKQTTGKYLMEGIVENVEGDSIYLLP